MNFRAREQAKLFVNALGAVTHAYQPITAVRGRCRRSARVLSRSLGAAIALDRQRSRPGLKRWVRLEVIEVAFRTSICVAGGILFAVRCLNR